MKYTEQLELETEQTRLHLANTIEELRGRLTPGRVLDEVLDRASDNGVGDYLRSFRQQVIDNPLPLGLMGMSIAWLMAASTFGSRSSDWAMRDKARAVSERARDGTSDLAGGARQVAADAADRASDLGRGLADQAADLRARAADQAADSAGQATALAAHSRDRMRDAADAASAGIAAASDNLTESARRSSRALRESVSDMGRSSQAASRALADFGREQPLIVAAAGLVIGAVFGALLPKTDAEDRLIGESSAAAKEKLRVVAAEQYDKAKDIAERTVEGALGANDGEAAHDRAERHETGEHREPSEFGPGPGPHSSGDASTGSGDAEHTNSGAR